MPEIENWREFTGRDKKGSFIMRLVVVKGAKHGHIRIYRNSCMEDAIVKWKWKVELLYWITKIYYGEARGVKK